MSLGPGLNDVLLQIFAHSVDGILITRPDGRILRANPAACRALQRTEVEICKLGRQGLVIMTPQLEVNIKARASAGSIEGELSFLRPDGSTFPVEYSSGLIPSTDADPLAYVIFRDVSDKRAAAQAQSLLSAIADTLPDPLFLKDLESRWLFANAATLAVAGKALHEVLGKTDLEIYGDPEIAEKLMELDRRVMNSGMTEVVEEVVLAPDGRRTYLSTKAPFRDASGNVMGVVGTAHDITARKQVASVDLVLA